MSPEKAAVDNKPVCMSSVTRIPGQIGWGVERPHLKAQSRIITDDMRVPGWPITKEHLGVIDKNKTAQFTRYEGQRALDLDHRLGVDYELYHALNMQAQRATLKCLDAKRRIEATQVNREQGLGKFDKMQHKLAHPSIMDSQKSRSIIDSQKVSPAPPPSPALFPRAAAGSQHACQLRLVHVRRYRVQGGPRARLHQQDFRDQRGRLRRKAVRFRQAGQHHHAESVFRVGPQHEPSLREGLAATGPVGHAQGPPVPRQQPAHPRQG